MGPWESSFKQYFIDEMVQVKRIIVLLITILSSWKGKKHYLNLIFRIGPFIKIQKCLLLYKFCENILFQIKCESYLPDVHGKFGDIEVFINSMEERDGFTIRNLTINVSIFSVIFAGTFIFKKRIFKNFLKFPTATRVCDGGRWMAIMFGCADII